MTDPPEEPRPGQPPIPGERRLAHPPSDRYRAAESPVLADDPAASPTRGIVFGIVAGVLGAAGITVLGGVLAISSGLVVIAGASGWAVAVGLRSGAGAQLTTDHRVGLALGLAGLSVGLGQVGLWLYARTEGGVLGPFDYLAETFGPLVLLELLAAWIVAWVTAR